MAYEVLARKYRPQQFADVVGQEHVTRTLANAIRTGRIAHAFLFVGPRGIGKTSIARIFAKALNCIGGPRVEPCDRCDSCLEIMGGRSMDVLEIDGASNNGVDQVRDLRDSVRYLPVRGPYKLIIIDEVHMLSVSAFNALLKTLEEPPPHAKFILATTDPQKVPTTIASRCQRFDLRRISVADIRAHLAKIAEKESVKISEDALLAIARGAEGGLRDAESALDQLIAFCGRDIGEDDVLGIFGLVSRQKLDELGRALLSGSALALLKAVDELDRNGKDLPRLTIELLGWLRNALVALHGPEALQTLDLTDEQRKALAEAIAGADHDKVLRMVEILIEAEYRLRFALSRRTILEIALLRCARVAETATLPEILRQLNRLKAALGGSNAGPVATPPSVTAPGAAAPPSPPTPSPQAIAERARADAEIESSPPAAAPRADGLDLLRAEWGAVTARAADAAPTLRSHLKDARPVAVTETEVRIAFPPESEESVRVCREPIHARAIQNSLRHKLGRAVRAVFEIASAADAPAPTAAAATAAPPPPPPTEERRDRASKEADLRRKIIDDPAVRNALEMFDGSITDIRP